MSALVSWHPDASADELATALVEYVVENRRGLVDELANDARTAQTATRLSR
jgi:hypothetical protein